MISILRKITSCKFLLSESKITLNGYVDLNQLMLNLDNQNPIKLIVENISIALADNSDCQKYLIPLDTRYWYEAKTNQLNSDKFYVRKVKNLFVCELGQTYNFTDLTFTNKKKRLIRCLYIKIKNNSNHVSQECYAWRARNNYIVDTRLEKFSLPVFHANKNSPIANLKPETPVEGSLLTSNQPILAL